MCKIVEKSVTKLDNKTDPLYVKIVIKTDPKHLLNSHQKETQNKDKET